MIFSIRIKASAAKELKRVVKPDRTRIVSAIDRLAENPFLGDALKGDMRGLRRLRVGDYRVLYEVREARTRRSGCPRRSSPGCIRAATGLRFDLRNIV